MCFFVSYLNLNSTDVNGVHSGNQSRVFFGAETDNDERLVNRVKPRLKTNGILLGFSEHCSGKKTKVGIVWNITRTCSE